MSESRGPNWKWYVCGLLLLATMLNYMDRQTLAQLAKTIRDEYQLEASHYGRIEFGFGIAFAFGGLFFGFLADRVSVRWLYPSVLIGWSLAGVATAYANEIGRELTGFVGHEVSDGQSAFAGFLLCRIVLGFFEAGHWPCALVTTQAILSRQDRSFGNSILQSGAAVGAILTPLIVLSMITNEPGGWRSPFVVIGCVGMIWIVPWLGMVRDRDLVRQPSEHEANRVETSAASGDTTSKDDLVRRFLVLAVVVVSINATWQFFRAWLPMFLEETHGYTRQQVGWFVSAYYIATDLGCLGVGALVKWLANQGWQVHSARMVTFFCCTALTMLSVVVAFLPAGWPLLAILLLVGAGSLGLFPNYYSFTQELSTSHQGKVAGALSFISWIGSAVMQEVAGQNITATRSYATGIILAGFAPLLALLVLTLFWARKSTTSA